MALRDPATEQLNEYKKSHQTPEQLTTSSGCPVGAKTIQTMGPRGPVLFQDVLFYDEISHFDRERIPERVVHAKGAGAYGYFEVTHDITKYCKAKMFEKIGKRTPMFARFSTVRGESGAADTVRDPRGFALKFYTEEGNWDMTGNNTPIFFIREPFNFPSFIHIMKRNPKTHLRDPDMFWDMMSLLPETVHHLSFVYTERGIPDGYRHMNGYGSHTFKFVNAKDEGVYVKFHFKTDQGIKNLSQEVADKLVVTDSDYAIRDLYNAIEKGNHPSWTFYIQVMTFAEAEKFRFNPFDLTLVWPHKEHPLIPVGRFTLNRNPQNYFAEVEQSAFNPSHLVPGIEPSPDRMLQARLLAYPDTHTHRLGANWIQIPVNCPFNARVNTNTRDGPQNITTNQEGAPNYYPNSFGGAAPKSTFLEHKISLSGDVVRHDNSNDDNFTQARNFYRNVLNEKQRADMCHYLAEDISKAAEFIQKRQVDIFNQVDPTYGAQVQKYLDQIKHAK